MSMRLLRPLKTLSLPILVTPVSVDDHLGDARAAEADVAVHGLHDAVQPLKLRAEGICEGFIGEVVDDGLVVFVNEDDDR